jgi:hypothetical protein
MNNDYYTYAYLREDRTPYYIGKGRGKRAYDKRRKIKPPKDKSLILFLKKGLTEAEAFKHEIYMIFVLGRKDLGTGILRNLTNGGDGASGAVRSEEFKKKMSEANSGEKNPMFNVRWTEERKKAHSEKMLGVPHTKEHKEKISEALSGEKNPMFGVRRTEEWKQANSGENNSNYGKTGALSPISKAIRVIRADGTELHYGSGWEAARDLKIPQSSLCYLYLKSGKVLTKGKFKGWQFLYENR